MSSKILQADVRVESVRGAVLALEPQIQALGGGLLQAPRFIAGVVQSVEKVPKLLECEPRSLLLSALECASLGFVPGLAGGEAWLVPRGGKVQLSVGYRGLAALLLRGDRVLSLSARPVYAKDDFEFAFGLGEDTFRHVPTEEEDPGPVRLAYAIARLRQGEPVLEITVRRDIERARAMNTQRTETAWATHFPEMAAKTAVRRLSKLLDPSPNFSRALGLDDGEIQAGDGMGFEIPDDARVAEFVEPERGDGAPVARPATKAGRAASRLRRGTAESGAAAKGEEIARSQREPDTSGVTLDASGKIQDPEPTASEEAPWADSEDAGPPTPEETDSAGEPTPVDEGGSKPRAAGETTLVKLRGAVIQASISDEQLEALLTMRGVSKVEDLTLVAARELIASIEDGTWDADIPF